MFCVFGKDRLLSNVIFQCEKQQGQNSIHLHNTDVVANLRDEYLKPSPDKTDNNCQKMFFVFFMCVCDLGELSL